MHVVLVIFFCLYSVHFSYAVMFLATALHDIVRLHALRSCYSFANLCCKNTTLNIEDIYLHEMELIQKCNKQNLFGSQSLVGMKYYDVSMTPKMAKNSHEEFTTLVANFQ